MKYEFMAAHEHEFSVKRMCSALGVQRSGYYAWKQRPVSAREQENAELLAKILEIFQISQRTYGSLRIQHHFVRLGYVVSRQRVTRLMKKAHLIPRKAAKWRPQTTKQRPGARTAPNLLNQDFTATKPNEKWVCDITYVDTKEGWLYLAVILDLYSRNVVGWSMSDRVDTRLVVNAWEMAVNYRHPSSDLLHHSDRGCQYTSDVYLNRLESTGCRISMSRTGNCYDNAAMESFFATLKGECADRRFKTRYDAQMAIFEYIEIWYNRKRLHSSLGYLSPVEFEQISGH